MEVHDGSPSAVAIAGDRGLVGGVVRGEGLGDAHRAHPLVLPGPQLGLDGLGGQAVGDVEERGPCRQPLARGEVDVLELGPLAGPA